MRAPSRCLLHVTDDRPRKQRAAPRHVAFLLSVPNNGYDWGAYHAGLGFVLGRCAPRSVTLMNDSVYVIEDALEGFLQQADRSIGDVVGATDSLTFRHHLQSYFLQLAPGALSSPLPHEFLTTYVPVSDKHYVVNAYEVGFSRRAAEIGLVVHPVFPIEEMVAASPKVLSGSELAPESDSRLVGRPPGTRLPVREASAVARVET